MLRATIEIVPWGDEALKKHIVTVDIARQTPRDNPETYKCCVFAQDGELVNIYPVKNHFYQDGAPELVRRALEILVLPEAY